MIEWLTRRRDASTTSLAIESHMNLISFFFFFVSMFFGKAIILQIITAAYHACLLRSMADSI